MKKHILSLATGLFLGFTASGIAAQVINLQSGQQVTVQGSTITCNLNIPSPQPIPTGGNLIQYQGQTFRLYRGTAGQAMARNLSTNVVRDLGGVILEDPVGAVVNNQAYIFARGSDTSAFYRTLTPGDTWKALGGKLLETPQVIVLRDEAYVVVRGTDTSIFYTTLSNGSNWIHLGGLTSAPIVSLTAFSDSNFYIEVYGTSGQLFRRSLTTDWELEN